MQPFDPNQPPSNAPDGGWQPSPHGQAVGQHPPYPSQPPPAGSYPPPHQQAQDHLGNYPHAPHQPAQAGAPQGYGYGPAQQAQGGWPAQPYPHPQQHPAAPAPSAAPGVIGIILAVLAVGPLGLAIFNLHQAQRLALDVDLPRFARGVVADANLGRVLVFSGAAGACALVALVLGVVGRRGIPGKLSLGLGALVFAGTGYAQVGRATFDRTFPPGKHERDEEDDAKRKRRADRDAEEEEKAKSSAPPPAAESPIANPKQGAYRLGRDVGLAAIGRARGEPGAAGRIFARAETTAKDLGVTLAPLPVLSGDKTKDTADAMHYLLDTVGKPVAGSLGAKHGQAHAAAFELGIKLNLLRLLYLPNDKLGQGLGASCDRLATRAGLPAATLAPLMAKVTADASQDAVDAGISSAEGSIDRELAAAPAAPPPPKRKYRLDEKLR